MATGARSAPVPHLPSQVSDWHCSGSFWVRTLTAEVKVAGVGDRKELFLGKGKAYPSYSTSNPVTGAKPKRGDYSILNVRHLVSYNEPSHPATQAWPRLKESEWVSEQRQAGRTKALRWLVTWKGIKSDQLNANNAFLEDGWVWDRKREWDSSLEQDQRSKVKHSSMNSHE